MTEASSFMATEGRGDLVSGQEVKAGHLLGGRFILERVLKSSAMVSQDQIGKEFPDLEGFSSPKHLGRGGSGDVWEAYDSKLKMRVAVKIFYSQWRWKWLTWNMASEKEKRKLETQIEECLVVQNILKQSSLYPQGAGRICNCLEEHISENRNTDNVNFLVFESCGSTLTAVEHDLGKLEQTKRITRARELTKQLLEAAAFLNMLEPPLIHHDLKPENVVAMVNSNSDVNLKVIDFGLDTLVWGLPENQYANYTRGTRRYMPPEFVWDKVAFRMPAYSFDMYSVGLIHLLLVCPGAPGFDSQNYHQSWTGEICSGLPTVDVDFIRALTNSDNKQRPSPLGALRGKLFMASM